MGCPTNSGSWECERSGHSQPSSALSALLVEITGQLHVGKRTLALEPEDIRFWIAVEAEHAFASCVGFGVPGRVAHAWCRERWCSARYDMSASLNRCMSARLCWSTLYLRH
jgi:hypothetical protein